MATRRKKKPIDVETLRHDAASRKNIPTAEFESVLRDDERSAIRLAYQRRNADLDPQLVWRGKDEQDSSDLVVHAPPLYIQEKLHPKVLIDQLMRESRLRREAEAPETPDLFADFNGLPDMEAKTEFYSHDQHWSNRMILGDSLQVMASLAEREGLRGQVQCIYFDPPYGIKFNSNFQWSTTTRDVKDNKADHITREPEQVKAFRDTWSDGIHSYLAYLRDRLTIARELLADSGSIFLQIGIENAHRIRNVLDEVYGEKNHIASIVFRKTTGKGGGFLDNTHDVVIWFAKNIEETKSRKLYFRRSVEADRNFRFDFKEDGSLQPANEATHRIARMNPITSQSASSTTLFEYDFQGRKFRPGKGGWKTNLNGMETLRKAQRLTFSGKTLGFVRPFEDYPYQAYNDIWDDTRQSGFGNEKIYVVQTGVQVIQRCILMSTDPGDLVLDPTCGSGTTAYVAENWGRRWITIDTSRVALALARTRLMGARLPYYYLVDSESGQIREGELTEKPPEKKQTHSDIRQGFVYERVPHITLESIANNKAVEEIWERWQETLEPLRNALNDALGETWEEWQIPREAAANWSDNVRKTHERWWQVRIERQKEIDASIAAKADVEYLYDNPYVDNRRTRVAGPFTVESLSPHRTLAVDHEDELVDPAENGIAADRPDFSAMVLDNLRTSGVQQVHKEDRITFESLTGWPGKMIAAEGRYREGASEDGADGPPRRAAVLIGPEFGTVARQDLVAAAREAADAGFDVLIACAFNYDAHATDFSKLGKIPILKARMNADLHMAGDLKNTGNGNLFVVFGEPDIDIEDAEDDQIQVRINGVDVFHPSSGEVQSDGPDGIAVWFIDTDYNEESFFVRHAYFPGTSSDPYKALKTTLKAEIDEEAWESLRESVSRPFPKPSSGRIAVKVINHLGDEVMKVYQVT